MGNKLLNYIIISFILFIELSATDFNNSISGYVIDIQTNKSLPGVNVYLSGTTFGASTNNKGYFYFENIPPGNYDLVASMIGYKSRSKLVNIKIGNKLEVKFELEATAYELENIEVKADRPDQWFENLNEFKELFLGQTYFTKYCEIENEIYLEFEKKENGDLKAYCNVPLIIINRALGYKINCNLISFYYESNAMKVWMNAKSYFSELSPKNYDEFEIWKENRNETYNKSLTNFLLWLKKGEVTDGEYKLTLMDKLPSKVASPKIHFVINSDQIIRPIKNNKHSLIFTDFLEVKGKGVTSYILLLHKNVTIDEFGYPEELRPYEVYGYWGRIGLANQLPMYYHLRIVN